MTDLARKRAVRAGHRGVIAKLTKEADYLLNENVQIEEIQASKVKSRLQTIDTMLREKLKVVKGLDQEILELCEVTDISKEVEEADEIVSRVLDTQYLIIENQTKSSVSQATKTIEHGIVDQQTIINESGNEVNEVNSTASQQATQDSELQTSGNSGTSTMNTEQLSNLPGDNSLPEQSHSPVYHNNSSNGGSNYCRPKLPKLVLPKFRGEITNYRTFWDSFESAVHKNPELSQIDKFNYLKSLLEGRALRTVQGLTVSESNYQSAIEILQQRFGKPQQIISAHMDELMKIPACNNDKPSQLRYIYDKISVHTRGLASLGVNSKQYGSLLIPVIMSKLPQEVRVQIARETTKDIWDISDILSVILKEVEAREVGENVKIHTEGRKPVPSKLPTNAAASLVAHETQFQTKTCKCAYCNEWHFSASCDKILDINTRKQILRRDNRCFVCLGKNHRSDQCEPRKSCRRCKGKHHQSICPTFKTPFNPSSHQQSPGNRDPPTSQQVQGGKDPPNSSNIAPEHTQTTSAVNTSTTKERHKVLLQTAVTHVRSPDGAKAVKARILFDSGSQRSYITNSLKGKLGLVPRRKETLNLNTFDNKQYSKQQCDLVQVSLQGKDGFHSISALCYPKICSPLSTAININGHPHLQNLDLADSSIIDAEITNNDIDILIGSDYYYDLILGEIVRGEGGPVAISSVFGWVVSGPTSSNASSSEASVANLIIESASPHSSPEFMVRNEDTDELTRVVRKFWETEAIGVEESIKPDEPNFVRDVQFKDDEGRYEVSLPWKEGNVPRSSGYHMCLKRLRQLQSKLKKDRALFDNYDKIIREQESAGIVERTNDNEDCGHYLPHHGVVRQDKETTKLRIVFDGSAKPSEDDYSLNDCLEKGPNSVPLLFDIIIRFREYPIGLTSDIEKAFHQINIAPADRKMIKFLWFDDINKDIPEIKQYQFRRLPFGLKPSPAILSGTVDYHLSRHSETDPNVVDLLKNSLYVDDFAGGASTDSQAFEVYESSKELMGKGGFPLRKWNTNSKELRDRVDSEKSSSPCIAQSTKSLGVNPPLSKVDSTPTVNEVDIVPQPTKSENSTTSDDKKAKILGLNWNVHTDELQCDTADLLIYARCLPKTKRSVLRLSAKVFDPLGLLSPFTINIKILFQILCNNKSGWDDLLDSEALKQWTGILNNITALIDVKVPRCYFHFTGQNLHHEIHGFSDASEKAYAAVVYLRTEHSNGVVEVEIIAAKTRVAPLHKQSIPRLELLGALILARLVKSILQALRSVKIDNVVLWTDSLTTICWIKNKKNWKKYVQNRVQEIRELTDAEDWRHCPGHLNPADLPSRGCHGKDLVHDENWWHSPDFLKLPSNEWPSKPSNNENDDHLAYTEIIKQPPNLTHSLTNQSNDAEVQVHLEKVIDVERFSSKENLLRVTARVLRFVKRCRKQHTPHTSKLEAGELREAESLWIKSIQSESFAEERSCLKAGRLNKMITQLRLFIDKDNIVRCEGRVSNSNLSDSEKTLILLPTKHKFTDLIIRECHQRVQHDGIRETLNCVRERFWIPRGRETVKRIIRRCVTCLKLEGKPFTTPKEPQLPSGRVSDDPPFTNSGVDFAGPLYVTAANGTQKAYTCLFTCQSTRAVHLELVNSLSTESFLQAFRRFASRRGLPAFLLTDNAKTFKSASKDVQRIIRSAEVQRALVNKGVAWEYITEKAPWHGGFWERMVKSVKRCLKKVLGRASLDFESLRTILVEVETTINNRPLTYMYDDIEGVSYPLTPSDFIYGRRISVLPNERHFEVISTSKSLTKRAKHHKRLLDHFVKRWRNEYLLSLREASSALHAPSREIIAVDDIVVIKNDSVPRVFWKLAKVEELIKSDDQVVRSAKVRVMNSEGGKTTVLRRPIQHLVPLELHITPESKVDDYDVPQQPDSIVKPVEREGRPPRRRAAVQGELSRRKLRR